MNDPFAFNSGDMKHPATLQHSEREHIRGSSDDHLAVEDVENPLQLLARASGKLYLSKDGFQEAKLCRSPHYIATHRREQHFNAW